MTRRITLFCSGAMMTTMALIDSRGRDAHHPTIRITKFSAPSEAALFGHIRQAGARKRRSTRLPVGVDSGFARRHAFIIALDFD